MSTGSGTIVQLTSASSTTTGTLADVMLRLAQKVGTVRYGTATAGTTTSLTDTLLPSVGQNSNGTLWLLSGNAAGYSRTILSNPTDKFTFAALSNAVAAGDRYAYVDKDAPRDLLMAAVNAGLRMVNPRLAEDITTLVDPEVDKYTLPTDVRNIISVELASSLTAPLYYAPHQHWREIDGELRFDYGYAPAYEDAIIRLTYREQHEDLTDDVDVIPIEVDLEALYWRSLIELLGMLTSLRPDDKRYPDLFQEGQIEWQRRTVTPPQRAARLAGW